MDLITSGVLPYAFLGLIVGLIASFIMKEGGYGILSDIILGIIGAVIGGLLIGSVVGVGDPFTGISWISLLIALFGAIVTVTLFRVATRRWTVSQ